MTFYTRRLDNIRLTFIQRLVNIVSDCAHSYFSPIYVSEKISHTIYRSTKGGYIAPIFVPSTPNSELFNLLKEVADKEAEPGLKFKIRVLVLVNFKKCIKEIILFFLHIDPYTMFGKLLQKKCHIEILQFAPYQI